jgi:hypothetical protein
MDYPIDVGLLFQGLQRADLGRTRLSQKSTLVSEGDDYSQAMQRNLPEASAQVFIEPF